MDRERRGNDGSSSALELSPEEFRALGHELIERIAQFYETLPDRPLTPSESPTEVRRLIGTGGLPKNGTPAEELLSEITPLVLEHSLQSGHPGYLGYIYSSASPLGALADLLASAVNANVGKWELAPIATEIEAQTIRWLAEFIGYPTDCGGIMVSGGNAANILGFIAARKSMTPWDVRAEGVSAGDERLTVYVSGGTHTWIETAADLGGLGTNAIRWIKTDDQERMDLAALRSRIDADRGDGCLPFVVVATAGTVSTGSVDRIAELATLCEKERLWLHVDGAYGAPAAALPESSDDLHALGLADSLAFDPHKWLYTPLEAACVLTKQPDALSDAFSFRPEYYYFDPNAEPRTDYYQHGLQNSRGFRALKVWVQLRQMGSDGYRDLIRRDIGLAQLLYELTDSHPELEARTCHLSVTTFRYRPSDLNADTDAPYLNALNEAIMVKTQDSGTLFVSNAIIDDGYFLRTCVVNFRTRRSDIEAIPQTIADIGRKLDGEMRPQ